MIRSSISFSTQAALVAALVAVTMAQSADAAPAGAGLGATNPGATPTRSVAQIPSPDITGSIRDASRRSHPAVRFRRSPQKRMRAAITPGRLHARAAAFQRIANANNGTRAAGTPGYGRSVSYVMRQLVRAGYKPRRQKFRFAYSEPRTEPSFRLITPTAVTYRDPEDFIIAENSGSGSVIAPVTPVALRLGLGNVSTSGCTTADFAGFPAGQVALVQRGKCQFDDKVRNAQAAGAAAVIILNQGNTNDEERQESMTVLLGTPSLVPVLGVSYAIGAALARATRPEVSITADVLNETRSTSNVIADTRGGRRARTIVIGSHLDSVEAGPGINDNGSGVAFNLELAVQMAKLGINPANRVRFAFWGAEEENQAGSTTYVSRLSRASIKRIALNLNFDMLASPNYGRLVYDGDGNQTGLPGPPGSAAIERAFLSSFAARGLATGPTPLDDRSDYAAFMEAGIPVGGVFAGAEDIKTKSGARRFGGTAGLPFDRNYHLAGDILANLNMTGFEELADAAAEVATTFALRKMRTPHTQGFQEG